MVVSALIWSRKRGGVGGAGGAYECFIVMSSSVFDGVAVAAASGLKPRILSAGPVVVEERVWVCWEAMVGLRGVELAVLAVRWRDRRPEVEEVFWVAVVLAWEMGLGSGGYCSLWPGSWVCEGEHTSFAGGSVVVS